MATLPNVRKPKLKDVTIAVLGPTGAGKTFFINLISGSELRVGTGLESSTDHIQLSKPFGFGKYVVTLVDTPGFDDTTKSDVDVLMLVSDFLVSNYKGKHILSGVIYLHRISDNRMGGTALRNFRMFTALCGSDALSNAAIVLNMWNEVSKEVGQAREQELKRHFFKSAVDAGTRMFSHDNTKGSADAILRHLAEREPIVLSIQKELVDERRFLRDTEAGKVLLGDLKAKEQMHNKQLRDLEIEIEEAMRQGSDEDRRALEGVRQRLAAIRDRNAKEQQRIQAESQRYQRPEDASTSLALTMEPHPTSCRCIVC